ncbi:MAG TPA: hypothetical protein VFR37_05060, partial [Longimicrobium sp.]|nr:hypothetical protein [Longimicrobium sp.]
PAGSQFDTRDPAGKGWTEIAADVRCAFSPENGDVRMLAGGREVSISGTIFVAPDALPVGQQLRPGDGVQLTAGRFAAPGRFTVAEARLIGGGGRFDDELDVEATAEPFQ